MKKVNYMLLLFALLTVSSCTKTCDQWHEGKECKTEIRQQYYGTYSGVNSVSGTTSVTVSEYPGNVARVNLGGIYADLTGGGTFSIPAQPYSYNGTSYIVNGNGSFTNKTLTQTIYINGNISYFTGSR